MGSSLTIMIISVLRGNTLLEGLNETFLALNSKVKNPQLTSQFRPIGLCNVAYKVITKVIVQRLKRVLPNLISLTQVSFVPKRHIDDNVIIIQELLHTMRKKTGNTGWMAIKLDLEKAYDRLDRNFIQDTLQEMRLPQPLVEVIMGCITTCSIRVLWEWGANGTIPSKTWHMSRRLSFVVHLCGLHCTVRPPNC